ncbi:hypothetical protein AG1IA_03380 [Rhizoctonia solani AG-1 IA]|uniref:Uncharacterized protein n=1 Tax=Thanatephorus cucumeris (strain AG1-IA) TaxID=983506 RepID=L8WX72_THACA|nr:hypothetical protein AG1IA_03380 [Rhizoctonia solani AG-1 IA]
MKSFGEDGIDGVMVMVQPSEIVCEELRIKVQ